MMQLKNWHQFCCIRISHTELEEISMICEKHSKLNRKIEYKRNNNYPVIIMLLSFFTGLIFFIPNVSGQDYTRWGLPEGAKLRLGKGSVGDLAYSSDGKHLFVDCSIGIWTYDAQTGRELDFITKQPDERTKISPHDNIYASWNSDNILHVRKLSDGSVINNGGVDTEELRRLAFSPDKRTLAFVQREDIYLWDFTTGEQKGILTGHTDWISSVVFSPDGSLLASAGNDKTLRLWNVATATYKSTFSGLLINISRLVFSPDGKTLISSNWSDTIRLWDVDSGSEKSVLDAPNTSSIAISPDGKTIASIKIDTLCLWDVETGTFITELSGHGRSLDTMAFSPDGSTLASGGGDVLFLWDTVSGARKMSIPRHTSSVGAMAFNSENNTVIAAIGDKLHLWDSTTGEHQRMIFGGYRDYHSSLAISPDGKTLASQEGVNTHLWDISSALHIFTLSEYRNYTRNNQGGSSSICFSPDGRFLAGGHRASTLINLWYMGRTLKTTLTGHTSGITSVAFSSDSRFLVSGSNDHSVKLWDVESEAEIATFTRHSDAVLSVAFNPDASVVASGGMDKTIMLWDVATGESKVIHTGHTNRINSVAFSRDGKTLISSAVWNDPTVRLWDVATGELITILTGHNSGVYNVVFSSDGRTLATGSGDGTVLLWNFDVIMGTKDSTARQLAEDVNRDGTVDIQDLIDVATQFGQSGQENDADVNGDGVVDIEDILLVAAALENVNAAPLKSSQVTRVLTASKVHQWLIQAQQIDTKTPALQRGIAALKQLLVLLIPKESVLLPNYPNPFNPETWIPYQLAKSSNVTVHIYAVDGQLVRTLKLGNQHAGIYHSQTRAAHWDGKNEIGEPVASGIYYYSLSTEDFTATRRMVIRK